MIRKTNKAALLSLLALATLPVAGQIGVPATPPPPIAMGQAPPMAERPAKQKLVIPGNGVITADAGAGFSGGYAILKKGDSRFYIDSNGKYAFDEIVKSWSRSQLNEDDETVYTGEAPAILHLVVKQGSYGVVREGKWLLPASFDRIEKSGVYWLATQNNKTRYYDMAGKSLLPATYTSMGYLDGDRFDVEQQGRWGIYSRSAGKLIIPCIYEAIDYCGGCGRAPEYVLAKKGGKWGVIDFKGNLLVPFQYDHNHWRMRSDNWVLSFSRNQHPIVYNLAAKKEYLLADDEQAEVLSNGCFVWNQNGKASLVNASGKQVLPPEYESITSPERGVYAVITPYVIIEQQGLFGLADTSGKIVLPPFSSRPLAFYGETIAASEKGLYSLYNNKGEKLINAAFSDLEWLEAPQVLIVRKEGRYGFYYSGYLSPIIYEGITDFRFPEKDNYYLEVEQDGWKGLVNLRGNVVVPCQFESIKAFDTSGERIAVAGPKGQGLYDTSGKQLIPATYQYLFTLENSNLLEAVAVSEERYSTIYTLSGTKLEARVLKTGIIGNQLLTQQPDSSYQLRDLRTGRITPLKWHYVSSHHKNEKLIAVAGQYEGPWQLFNIHSGSLLPGSYSYISFLENGYCRVTTKDLKEGVLNSNGQEVIPCVYNEISTFNKYGIAAIRQENNDSCKYGFIDTTGRIIVPLSYECSTSGIDYLATGHYLLLYRSSGTGYLLQQGIADMSGKTIIPPNYSFIFADTTNNRFLLQEKGRLFYVADNKGRILNKEGFEDVYPASINRYGSSVTLEFPLLVKENGKLRYVQPDGSSLPVSVGSVLSAFDLGR